MLGSDAWPSLPEADKERVLAEIGEIIAEVQRVPAGASRRSGRAGTPSCAGRSREIAPGTSASDCRKKCLDELDELLRDAATLTALDRPPVILTGEYIPENFLLNRDAAGWHSPGCSISAT